MNIYAIKYNKRDHPQNPAPSRSFSSSYLRLRLLPSVSLSDAIMTGREPVWAPTASPSPPSTTINLLSGSFALAAALSDLPRRIARSLLPPPPPPPPPAQPRLSGCAVPLFRPYVARVPWHGGARAFLSQLFPRYGHYCGPNWSSGKDGGSMLWDRRPVDWLDFCCYCHDIGYDTHDQARLLQADLAFLDCLERPRPATKGGAGAALLYRSMCIAGLRGVLIPYRMQLLRLQAGASITKLLRGLTGRGNPVRKTLDFNISSCK